MEKKMNGYDVYDFLMKGVNENLTNSAATSHSNVEKESDDLALEEAYPYIDLDLESGTLWSKCNVGANTPYEKGWMFPWGYGDHDYTDEYVRQRDYHISGNCMNIRPKSDKDAAYMVQGDNWRMPLTREFYELIRGTDQYKDTVNGIDGVWFCSKKNPNKKMFMVADYYKCYYWAADSHGGFNANVLTTRSTNRGECCGVVSAERNNCYMVRAVYNPPKPRGRRKKV